MTESVADPSAEILSHGVGHQCFSKTVHPFITDRIVFQAQFRERLQSMTLENICK